mgnify:FL=1
MTAGALQSQATTSRVVSSCPRCGAAYGMHRLQDVQRNRGGDSYDSCLICGYNKDSASDDVLAELNSRLRVEQLRHNLPLLSYRVWETRFTLCQGRITSKRRSFTVLRVALEYCVYEPGKAAVSRVLAWPWSVGGHKQVARVNRAFQKDTGIRLMGVAQTLKELGNTWNTELARKTVLRSPLANIHRNGHLHKTPRMLAAEQMLGQPLELALPRLIAQLGFVGTGRRLRTPPTTIRGWAIKMGYRRKSKRRK